MAAYRWCGNGCPPHDRPALCKTYIAKAVWDFATTRDLIDAILHRPALRRLCGWESLGEVPPACAAMRRGRQVGSNLLARVRPACAAARQAGAFARDGRPQRQLQRDLKANLADLPTACDWGCKKNSQAKVEYWPGYKANLDAIDGDIPVSFILTSASVHDSQVAIPLAQMTAERIANLYDLSDAAFQSPGGTAYGLESGHHPCQDAAATGGQLWRRSYW
jgi:hypothetical protein